MAFVRIRIEEMEYRPEDRSLRILAVDEFHAIVTIEVKPAFPRQLAADLDFVSRHPNTRVLLDGTSPLAERRTDGETERGDGERD